MGRGLREPGVPAASGLDEPCRSSPHCAPNESGQRYEGPDHRQPPPDQDRGAAEVAEEPLGAVQVARV